MRLPHPIDPVDFDERFRVDFSAWRQVIAEIAEAHDLPTEPIRPFDGGSNLVAEVDRRWVVKVFPDFHRHQWESECRVLPHFQGLPVRVPELVAWGERDDGYTYVVMSRLPGETLEDHWEDLSRGERAGLLRDIGHLMAAAHAAPAAGLADLEPRWERFLPTQLGQCRPRHLRLGAPAWVTGRLEAFALEALPALDLSPPHVVLTGEYTPFNLLFDDVDRRPTLSGMIDFGDAMVGPAVYDVLGPAVFLAGGDPVLLGAFFDALQLLPWPLPEHLRRGLLALLLLHRYSDLDAQIRVDGWRELGSLEALADAIFGG